MDAEHYIALGKMEATVKSLTDDVADIRTDQKTQNAKLDILIANMHRQQGTRAVSKVLFGLVTSGGFLGWLWEHFHK